MVFWVGGELLVATGFLKRGLRFLIEDIAESFVEEEREYELLVVTSVDGPAQERGGTPEVGFELLLRDSAHLASTWLNHRIAASPSIRVTSLTERL